MTGTGGNAVEGGELVRRAVEHALGARAIVAADVNDESVVEFAEILDGLDDTANLMVGVGLVGCVNIGLPDEELFLQLPKRVPTWQLRATEDFLTVRPRSQLRVLRHDTQLFLIGKNRIAKFFPSVLEEVHRADLVDPFLGGVMR